MSNNPDDISTKDKVDFCITGTYFVPKFFYNSGSNSSVSYLQQIFFVGCDKNLTNDNDIINAIKNVYNKPFSFSINTKQADQKPSWLTKDTTGNQYYFFA